HVCWIGAGEGGQAKDPAVCCGPASDCNMSLWCRSDWSISAVPEGAMVSWLDIPWDACLHALRRSTCTRAQAVKAGAGAWLCAHQWAKASLCLCEPGRRPGLPQGGTSCVAKA